MSKKTVLLITPSNETESIIKTLLVDNWEGKYELIRMDKMDEQIPASDICLLDEEALPENSTDFLAQSSFQLAPRPLIYIMNEEPADTAEFKTVKSLTADYLVKYRLTASGLHNTIRYAIENTELKIELEQQQKRYSSLFYNSVEPAFFLDKNWRITGVNDSFLKTLQTSSADVINNRFDMFLATKTARNELENKLQNLTTGGVDLKLHFITQKGQHEFLGHLRISPISESGLENGVLVNRIIAYHGTMRNISHEERLRSVKEKSKKIALTYRLARTMAHEIRNPLTNVNLAIDQLKDETQDNEDLDLYFGIIERGTKRIDDILSQLLSSSEKQVFKKTNFDVVTLFKSVVKSARDRSKLMGVNLKSHYNIDAAQLEGDKEKLKIAFTNLFTNAVECMDKEEQTIECGTYIDANYLCLFVRDNGIGMDDKQLESIFDPFVTNKKKGVGLGLTSTQTIISEHNGQIEVESTKGVGSSFTIYLPLD